MITVTYNCVTTNRLQETLRPVNIEDKHPSVMLPDRQHYVSRVKSNKVLLLEYEVRAKIFANYWTVRDKGEQRHRLFILKHVECHFAKRLQVGSYKKNVTFKCYLYTGDDKNYTYIPWGGTYGHGEGFYPCHYRERHTQWFSAVKSPRSSKQRYRVKEIKMLGGGFFDFKTMFSSAKNLSTDDNREKIL